MTENISYRKCTCDICGKVAKTSISGSLLPKEWEHFTIGKKEYDVCIDCFVKVDMAIEDLKLVNEHFATKEEVNQAINNAYDIIEELNVRDVANSSVHEKFQGVSWEELCEMAIKLFKQLK